MKLFIINVSVLAMVGLVSGSILPAFFPWLPIAPLFIFSLAISLVLSRGFLESLPLVVVLGLTADVAMLGRVGLLSGFAVGIAYTASFFSRRFVVEHAAFTMTASGAFLGVAAAVFPLFSDMILSGFGPAISRLVDSFSIGGAAILFLAGIAFSALSVELVRKYDDVTTRIGLGSTFHT